MLVEPPPPPGPTEIITKILQKLVTIKYPASTITFGLRHTAAEILTGEYTTIRGSMAGLAEAAGFAKPKAELLEEDSGDDTAQFGISAVTVSTARCKDATSANRMVFGVSATVCDIGKTLTLAAVPLWTLSLALLGLAIVTRNAAAVGYSLGDAGYEFFRWIFICLCSGNGILIAIIIHNLFMALSGFIIASADLDSGKLIDHLMPLALVKQIWVTDPTGTKTFFVISLVLIVIAIIIALVFLFIMGLAILARYVLTLALITMAPLAIATEGIPYMRFVFKDWLSSFLRVELLSVLNAFVVLLATSIAFKYDWSKVDLAKVQLADVLISILSAVGLLSIITAMNWSVFRYVFGTAIDMVSQMSQAAISTVGTLATLASGGALGTLAGAGAMARSLGNSLGIKPLQGLAQGINAGQNALRQNAMHQR
ncbi:MAG: hypothetical protein HC853_04690, partial [Anaerolineae bacterium]|nr:hypothetical protein [Anaerolineae bacterium]